MAHSTPASSPDRWHGDHGDLTRHAGDPESGAHGDHPTIFVYWVVFALLMILLAGAVLVGYLVGGLIGTLLSFAIGIAKALLIILYFMHVRYGTRLTWIFSGAAFVWLAILLSITISDYWTRPDRPQFGGSRPTLAGRADPMTRIVTSRTEDGPIDRP